MKTLALAILTACGAVDVQQAPTPAETLARQAMIAAFNAAMVKVCASMTPLTTPARIAWLMTCARFPGDR